MEKAEAGSRPILQMQDPRPAPPSFGCFIRRGVRIPITFLTPCSRRNRGSYKSGGGGGGAGSHGWHPPHPFRNPTSHAGLHSWGIPRLPSNLPGPGGQVAPPRLESSVAFGRAGRRTASARPPLGPSPLHVEPPDSPTAPSAGQGRGPATPMGGQKGARVRTAGRGGAEKKRSEDGGW